MKRIQEGKKERWSYLCALLISLYSKPGKDLEWYVVALVKKSDSDCEEEEERGRRGVCTPHDRGGDKPTRCMYTADEARLLHAASRYQLVFWISIMEIPPVWRSARCVFCLSLALYLFLSLTSGVFFPLCISLFFPVK